MSRDHNGSSECSYCGAPTKEHKHTLSAILVKAMQKLADAGGGPLNLRTLQLPRSEWQNFSKLVYWGFVEQTLDPATKKRKNGWWALTPKGSSFLQGHIEVHKSIWTYRGNVCAQDLPMIYAYQATDRVKEREHYEQDI